MQFESLIYKDIYFLIIIIIIIIINSYIFIL